MVNEISTRINLFILLSVLHVPDTKRDERQTIYIFYLILYLFPSIFFVCMAFEQYRISHFDDKPYVTPKRNKIGYFYL